MAERPLTRGGDALWAARFRRHVPLCLDVGAPLYADLFGKTADELEAGGEFLDIIAPYREEAEGMLLPLRLMAQVHYWVLRGELPELAAYYPTAGGTMPYEGAWPRFRTACLERADKLQRLLGDSRVQANYAGCCAPLMGGFLFIARQTGCHSDFSRSAAAAACFCAGTISVMRRGSLPCSRSGHPLDGEVRVVERHGCDPNPVDPTTEDGALPSSRLCMRTRSPSSGSWKKRWRYAGGCRPR